MLKLSIVNKLNLVWTSSDSHCIHKRWSSLDLKEEHFRNNRDILHRKFVLVSFQMLILNISHETQHVALFLNQFHAALRMKQIKQKTV